MTAVHLSLGLFVLAALGGATLAVLHAKSRPAPMALPVVHGGVAASALSLLAYAVLAEGAAGLARPALGGLVGAALGGFFLLSFRLRKQPPPMAVVGLHGLIAAFGVALLAASVLAP